MPPCSFQVRIPGRCCVGVDGDLRLTCVEHQKASVSPSWAKWVLSEIIRSLRRTFSRFPPNLYTILHIPEIACKSGKIVYTANEQASEIARARTRERERPREREREKATFGNKNLILAVREISTTEATKRKRAKKSVGKGKSLSSLHTGNMLCKHVGSLGGRKKSDSPLWLFVPLSLLPASPG